MKLDYDIIRWRFLIIGFLCLFFLIGGTRYLINKINEYRSRQPWELRGHFPPGSLGFQIQDAQKRAKNQ